MFHGVLALVGRSLRADARAWQPHLARLGLMGAIYVAVCVAIWESRSFAAPGLRFFYGIAYLNLLFMTLMGISYFSTPISEEKEEDTLGLMMMAGISPLGILLGKSGGRLVQALLLVAVQYPFTLLAVTMGGVTASQVGAVYLGLMAYMVLLGGFGLLCSTIGSSHRFAATWMICGLSAYVFVPLTASNYLSHLLRSGLNVAQIRTNLMLTTLDFVSQVSVFQQVAKILNTGFGGTPWNFQVVSNVVLGVSCFGLAWACFGICSRQPASEPVTRGLVSRGRGLLRWFSPGRAWTNPLIWKDFYFVSGGLGMIPVRLAFCGVLYGIAVLQYQFYPQGFLSFYQGLLSLAVTVDASRVMARSLSDELRGQTLSALTLLPRSRPFVVYSKFAGALLGWLPALIVPALVAFLTADGRNNFIDMLRNPEASFLLSMCILIPNLAALLALTMRWGAVPASIVFSYGLHLFVAVMLGRQNFLMNQFVGVVMLLAFSPACHLAILWQMRRLTERA